MPLLDVRALDHTGIGVADLEEALAVLIEVFGARLLRRAEFTPEPGSAYMAEQFAAHPGSRWDLAALDLAGHYLELFAYQAPDRRTQPPRASDVGAVHLALAVPDVDAAVAQLAAEPRITVLGAVQTVPPGHPQAGRRWIYLRTRWGLLIELVADAPTGPENR